MVCSLSTRRTSIVTIIATIKNTVEDGRERLKGVLAICLVIAGIFHFVAPQPLISIVPNFLPYPDAIVYISGVIEIFLGIGLLVPSTSQLCAWGIVALFIAIYPASLNMAFNHIHIDGVPDGWWFQGRRFKSSYSTSKKTI